MTHIDAPSKAAACSAFSCAAWAAVLFFAMISLCGCTSVIDGERGLPPFVGYGPNNGTDSAHWAVRPVASYDREGDRSDFFALWPLIRSTRTATTAKDWLLPLWYDGNLKHPDGTEDHDGFVLPFFFYGDDSHEGSYFMTLPLGGVLKGILGQDHILWGAFPFFIRLIDRTRVSTHVLFPFFNRVTGPFRDGWRLWPFYGRYTATTEGGVKKYDRRYYLWPFFHAQENNLDTSRPVNARWFWPFWGDVNATTFRELAFFWPLLTYRVSKDDPRNFRFQFFPFVTRESWESPRRRIEQTDVFPIFGVKESPTYYRQYFLYPIQRRERIVSESRVKESSWILPIYWHHRAKHRVHGVEEEVRRLYPFVTYVRRKDGTRELRAFDPLPFEDGYGFERTYGKLFRIFHRVDRGLYDGTAWEVLWGLVQRESKPRKSRFSFLGGLFESRQTPGRRGWSLFWIPFGDA